jgi:hypothetical protein
LELYDLCTTTKFWNLLLHDKILELYDLCTTTKFWNLLLDDPKNWNYSFAITAAINQNEQLQK